MATELASPPDRRVLVVDDEESVLKAVARVLSHRGWQIHTRSNPRAALAELTTLAPEVVISDFRMPQMTGVEFLVGVKESLPSAQRILLTGQSDQQAFADAINRSEVFRFIPKPWENSELVLTVQSALEQAAVLRENERLQALTLAQNEELRTLAVSLEARVQERTAALATAKLEWETAFDAIDTPLSLVDQGFSLLRANRAFRAAGSARKAPSEATRCHQALFGRDTPCVGCPLPGALSTRRPATAEVPHRGRWYQVSAYPVPEQDHAACTYRDITEEQAVLRQQMDAERMAAIGQLAGGVAHEINNPMGGILAFAQLMKREPGRSSADLEALELIEDSALRCKRIITSLLNFSRRSSGSQRQPMDLSRCMEEVATLFTAQLKATPEVAFEVVLGADLPRVLGNASQLTQVALTLLQNALHALPRGPGRIRLETATGAGGCLFAVTDTGSGIAGEDLPRIFEPWFTTKPHGEGTGLGLATASRIVADHGGTLQVASELGRGSRFTVTLPGIVEPEA